MNLLEHYPLTTHNTLGLPAVAEHFVQVATEAELEEALAYAQAKRWPVFVLGGGSNIVLQQDIRGLVIQPSGLDLQWQPLDQSVDWHDLAESGADLPPAWVRVGAGVVWDELVSRTLAHGLNGLENLSMIPGSVGAAPVQNIGAYGVELSERLHSLRAFHIGERCWLELNTAECEFAYRNSRFKREQDQYVIQQIVLRLGPDQPRRSDYRSLAEALNASKLDEPSALDIATHVRQVRTQRLPDPNKLANAGSFFHNPIVDASTLASLLQAEADLAYFPLPGGGAKLAAGWLIERCGFKGYRDGSVGVHTDQALVLVHHGGGTGEQLLALASRIQHAVHARFGVSLKIEPRIV